MPPNLSEAKLRAKWEKEQKRKRVLELYKAGGLSLAGIATHPDVRLSPSTVQYTIKDFGDRDDVQTKKQLGHLSKLTNRCVLRRF